MSDPQMIEFIETMNMWHWPLVGLGIIEMILAVVLIYCGIKLLNQHANVYSLIKRWAIAKILYSLVAVTITALTLQEVTQITTSQQPASSLGMSMAMTETILIIMFAVVTFIQLLIMCALPVFILVWFGRQKVREEMMTW